MFDRWTYRGLCPGPLLLTLVVLFAAPVLAEHTTYCAPDRPNVEIDVALPGTTLPSTNRCLGAFYCKKPEIGDQVDTVTVDPMTGLLTLRISVEVTMEGNVQNDGTNGTTTDFRGQIFWFDSDEPPAGDCHPGPFPGNGCTPFVACGNLSATLPFDRSETYLEIGGLSCTPPVPDLGSYVFSVYRCRSPFSSCQTRTDSPPIDLSPAGLAQALGCPVIPTDDCDRCEMNRTVGPSKTGFTGDGPVCLLLPDGGPGADLSYRSGGAGAAGLPGSAAWNAALGRHWSHSYAQRIVLDPDETHVWLITERGTFREFGNLTGGDYETLRPSDEKRTLHRIGVTGWKLRDPDGTVVEFDTNGLWLSTTDRNGNATTGDYVGDELIEVGFPDGRSETFTYDASGKLETITEVGVVGSETRTWIYVWNGDDLERVERPDGTAWVMVYDPARPGYLKRLELEGTDGVSKRVETAWEYDGDGNVSKVWRGDAAHDGPDAVDLWQFAYDDPAAPTETTVTDPVGDEAIYAYDRDPASEKPRLLSVTGDCPQCGLAANSTLLYGDAANPLLPTEVTDGNGNVTRYEYDEDTGRMTQRTRAADLGPPLERVTTWKYEHPSYPGLVTEMAQPSVEPGELRRTVYQRETDGDVEVMRIQGFEAGVAFDLPTRMQHNAGGRPLAVDPPGYGDAGDFSDPDVTSYAYDGNRGNGFLVVESRTDPVVGTTTFGHDDHNRLTSVTDPAGVTTVTTYDDLDRVETVTQAGEVSPADDLVTTHLYTVFGDLDRTVLPRGNVVDFSYDPAGRLTQIDRRPNPTDPGERVRFTLDGAGNRILEVHERWDSGSATWVEGSRTAYVFDSRCHLDKMIAGTAPDQSVTEYDYDCNGNLEKVWDGNHPSIGKTATPTATYAYDALDRLTSLTRPWSGAGGGTSVTAYGYDVQDHLTSVTDAEGSVTGYDYSDRDLLTEEVSPVSGTTGHAYDEHGELTETTDARLVTVTRVLDPLDRVTEVHYPTSSLDTTYDYDDPTPGSYGQGRLAAITRHGQTVAYAYDAYGRMTRDGDLTYAYDANGNRRRIVYPGGVIADYTFDLADREESLTVTHGALVTPAVNAAGYLPAGPLTALTLGNGAQETRLFDERHHPSSIALAAERTRGWAYQTDGVGNILEIAATADCPAGVDLSNVTYTGEAAVESCSTLTAGPAVVVNAGAEVTFRAAEKVILNDGFSVADGASFTAATDPDLSGDLTRTYAYQDVEYFLTSADGPWGSLDWTYDRIGNRLSESRNGLTDGYSYTPNAASGNTALLSSIALGVGGTRTFTYSASGHQETSAASGNNVTFDYDDEGRLGQADRPTAPNVDPVDFLYDGRSYLRQAGDLATTGTVQPTYDSAGLLHALLRQEGAAEPQRRYHVFYLAGRPVGQLATENGQPDRWWYLTTDHLGTPLVATADGGSELWENRFEPFGGDPWAGTPLGALEGEMYLRFPGQWADGTWQNGTLGAGLSHNVYRWYASSTGRYSRSDPLFALAPRLGGRQSLASSGMMTQLFNMRDLSTGSFEYAEANPLVYEDARGLLPVGPQAYYARRFFRACADELDRRRSQGHQRFPGQANDFMRHCVVSCEAADGICGRQLTRLAGAVNEAQGIIIDIRNMQTGAFEFEDFRSNEEGLWCQAHRGWCSCETCCMKRESINIPATRSQPFTGFGGP